MAMCCPKYTLFILIFLRNLISFVGPVECTQISMCVWGRPYMQYAWVIVIANALALWMWIVNTVNAVMLPITVLFIAKNYSKPRRANYIHDPNEKKKIQTQTHTPVIYSNLHSSFSNSSSLCVVFISLSFWFQVPRSMNFVVCKEGEELAYIFAYDFYVAKFHRREKKNLEKRKLWFSKICRFCLPLWKFLV